nr:NAD-dependent epimerase/dehydratase family protein [Desulfosoma caldarium]
MHSHDDRVVSQFIAQALFNKPITVFGDGFPTRSFGYVDDMVDGFLRLMESPEEVTSPILFKKRRYGLDGQPIN